MGSILYICAFVLLRIYIFDWLGVFIAGLNRADPVPTFSLSVYPEGIEIPLTVGNHTYDL